MRLPAVTTLKNRSASTSKDGRMLNSFAEQKGGVLRAVKRPSLIATFTPLQGGAGGGQGMFAYSTPSGLQTLVAIQNDVLDNSPTPTATRLAFSVEPVDWKIDTAFSPSIVVTAKDSFGNTMSSFSGDVTLSFYSNPNGGTLSGTLTVAAVSGVATFSNVKINKVGGSYRLRADATLMRTAVSSTFKVVSNLSFTVEPQDTLKGVTMATVEVSIVDSAAAAITGYTGNVTIAIGNNAGGGTLSGTLTVAAVLGVAQFTDLSISENGNGYTLVATEDSGGLAQKQSSSFDVTVYTLTAVDLGLTPPGYGFIFGALGAFSPANVYGNPVLLLESQQAVSSPPPFSLTRIDILGTLTQNFFSTLQVGSGAVLDTSLATFSTSLGVSSWQWDNTIQIPSAGSYSVAIA